MGFNAMLDGENKRDSSSSSSSSSSSASSSSSSPAISSCRLNGRQTWEKAARKRVTFDLRRCESLNMGNNNNNNIKNNVNNDVNNTNHSNTKYAIHPRDSLPSNIDRQQPIDSDDVSNTKRQQPDINNNENQRDATSRISNREPAYESSRNDFDVKSERQVVHRASKLTDPPNLIDHINQYSSTTDQSIDKDCRLEYLSNGYSNLKTHRRKASLGTKDFTLVFPDLVSDNFDLMCRVAV